MITEIYLNNKDVTLARLGPFFIFICHCTVADATTPGLIEAVEKVLAAALDGIGFITIVEAKARPPDAAVRKRIADFLQEHGEQVKCAALVIEGKGFVPSMVRSVLAGLSLLVNIPFPQEILPINEVGPFLAKHFAKDSGLFTPEFERLLRQIRTEGVIKA